MQPQNRKGKQTLCFPNSVYIAGYASIVGKDEGKGMLCGSFDQIIEDDLWGMESWEKAECKFFEEATKLAISKSCLKQEDVDCFMSGDLLNQIISASFSARSLGLPYLGLYSACSTMTEMLLVGSALISSGFVGNIACTTGSHFCTAERQYRFPLPLGSQRTPTAQRTVTGAGSTVLSADVAGNSVRVTHGTIGKVVDLGIKDANNMGAAMAPAAADTICTHFQDMGEILDNYDLIVTGDLGKTGSKLFQELCMENGLDVSEKHFDCGAMMYRDEQDTHSGGSGCGCCASILNGYLLTKIASGNYNKVLVAATGALLSPNSSMQNESIPCISHAVLLERIPNAIS